MGFTIHSEKVSQWLTEKEVAQLLGFSISTLQKHRFHHRGMPYVKIGHSVRYALKDVMDFMENHKIFVDKI